MPTASSSIAVDFRYKLWRDVHRMMHIGPKLGSGVQAGVWSATHRRTGRAYAVKVFSSSRTSYSGTPSEYYILQLLGEHRNIVNAHMLLESASEGLYALVLDQYHRTSVADLVANYFAQGTHPPEAWVWTVLADVARALRHCHARAVVHRDVKPGNMLCDARWNVVLGDFGSAARWTDPDFRHDPRVTDPDVLAPEHAQTPASDVYALGASAKMVMTGSGVAGGFPSQQVARSYYSRELVECVGWCTAVSSRDRARVKDVLRFAEPRIRRYQA
jgi:serine/threonine protein kinase